MGGSGFITLVNGTPYQWNRLGQQSMQMTTWDFPAQIPPQQSISVLVEWGNEQSWAQSTYSLAGTGSIFQVQGVLGSLQVYLLAISTQNNAQDSAIILGWVPNDYVNFILSGREGNFSSSNMPAAWMQTNLTTLSKRPLRHLCISGTHDAGMHVATHLTPGAHNCNVLTQHISIGSQLLAGSRYFDIRPVIRDGTYYTGHYSQQVVRNGPIEIRTLLGATGQAMQEIIDQINFFTASNHELIIIRLSHDMNTARGSRSDVAFTQAEWNGVMSLLSGTNHRFVALNPTTVDLTMLPLEQFIGQNKAAVIFIVRPTNTNISLGNFVHAGFYKYSQLDAYNVYSKTNNKDEMTRDQIEKMRTVRITPDSQYFLLSWTLTQDKNQATRCSGGQAPSILELAAKANPELYKQIISVCTSQSYPNILYLDGTKTPM